MAFKFRVPKAQLRFCAVLGYVHFSTPGTSKEKRMKLFLLTEDKIIHIILEDFDCRWLPDQNIAHFPTSKKARNFLKI